jgi:Ser/Thr protein kinase RdoA (MazF antagonist)
MVLMSGPPDEVLDRLGLRRHRVVALRDVPLGNGNWLVAMAGGQRFVLRRYYTRATREDLAYEHSVLSHLAAVGWAVPTAASEPVFWRDCWYCLTRYVPGEAVTAEDASQRSRRGRDLGRLHLALRGLDERIGQRPGWRPQHTAVTVRTANDWEECVRGLASVSPRLASWAQAAATRTQDSLAAIGAAGLPVMVVHGDFAEWNVHYVHGKLAGVIDFGLTHVDTRPYELAIARTYRAPQAIDAYRAELAASGWPLSELEEAAITPVYRAFRVGMAAAEMEDGRITGSYDLAMIERQLSRTGTAAPLPERQHPYGATNQDRESRSAARACRSLKAAAAWSGNGSSLSASIQRSTAIVKASIPTSAPSRAVSSSAPRSRRAALIDLAIRACLSSPRSCSSLFAVTTSTRWAALARCCGVIVISAAANAACRHSVSVASGEAARMASANSLASTSSPPNSTSRLSAKCRKNVARFKPARSAICATVVSSYPFSTNRSSAAASRRSRAFGAHLLTVTA